MLPRAQRRNPLERKARALGGVAIFPSAASPPSARHPLGRCAPPVNRSGRSLSTALRRETVTMLLQNWSLLNSSHEVPPATLRVTNAQTNECTSSPSSYSKPPEDASWRSLPMLIQIGRCDAATSAEPAAAAAAADSAAAAAVCSGRCRSPGSQRLGPPGCC